LAWGAGESRHHEEAITMRKPPTWQLLLLMAGVVLGLIAGPGVAAPAAAAEVYRAAAQRLTLEASSNGRYVVEGRNYKDSVVDVWIVKVSGRDKVIDHQRVRPGGDDDFTVRGWGLACDETYQAVSYSRDDGWDQSDRERVRCGR
jgi:hypothetical protein